MYSFNEENPKKLNRKRSKRLKNSLVKCRKIGLSKIDKETLERKLQKKCQKQNYEQNITSENELDDSSKNLQDSSNDVHTSKSIKIPKKELSNESSILNSEQMCNLNAWGLPNSILTKYFNRGIDRMFPWQVECLSNLKVLNDCCNIIYSAPTSAGKTLVAEILAIKTILERKKKVIIILPFVSVVREKMHYFQDILSSTGVRVAGFMGSYNPPGGFSLVHVAICTIEKANNIVNRLLEENTIDDLGAVVIDELHLLGDSSRGYILELLLTKLLYISRKKPELRIQLIGMSATLPNLSLLSEWLNAELYKTDFRPIPLYEQCFINGTLYNNKFEEIRKIESHSDIMNDTDNVIQFCLETIYCSCSILIFCSTKNWCEKLAQQIAAEFRRLGCSDSPLGQCLREQLNTDLIVELLEQLKQCPVGLDQILKKTASFGVAFHHAGLTMDERDIIENGFRRGILRVLVATTTLSSGVNLPARRVIVRSPLFSGRLVDILSYRQMIGRAGRMGKDVAGESILICQTNERYAVEKLFASDLTPISSCLEGTGLLRRAILEIVASGVATTVSDVQLFTESTLLSRSELSKDMKNYMENTIDFLIKNEFIKQQNSSDSQKCYFATSLAKACLSSAFTPEDALTLFSELDKARQSFILDSELHVIYLVTPYSVCKHWVNLDWMHYYRLWEKLSPADRRVGERVGVSERYLSLAISGVYSGSGDSKANRLQIHRKFYTALALKELVEEVPLNEVSNKYQCNRGLLQSLQQSASTFAGMVTAFCRQLGWSSMELLVSQFQERLQFGVNRELLDLMRLSSLNGIRARALFNAGIETVAKLAAMDVCTLENILCRAVPFESELIRNDDNENQQRKVRTNWIVGKEGLTDYEAAAVLISEARNFLKYELGFVDAKWEKDETNSSHSVRSDTEKSINQLNNTNTVNHSTNVQILNQSTESQADQLVESSVVDQSKDTSVINQSTNLNQSVNQSISVKNQLNFQENTGLMGEVTQDEIINENLIDNEQNCEKTNNLLEDNNESINNKTRNNSNSKLYVTLDSIVVNTTTNTTSVTSFENYVLKACDKIEKNIQSEDKKEIENTLTDSKKKSDKYLEINIESEEMFTNNSLINGKKQESPPKKQQSSEYQQNKEESKGNVVSESMFNSTFQISVGEQNTKMDTSKKFDNRENNDLSGSSINVAEARIRISSCEFLNASDYVLIEKKFFSSKNCTNKTNQNTSTKCVVSPLINNYSWSSMDLPIDAANTESILNQMNKNISGITNQSDSLFEESLCIDSKLCEVLDNNHKTSTIKNSVLKSEGSRTDSGCCAAIDSEQVSLHQISLKENVRNEDDDVVVNSNDESLSKTPACSKFFERSKRLLASRCLKKRENSKKESPAVEKKKLKIDAVGTRSKKIINNIQVEIVEICEDGELFKKVSKQLLKSKVLSVAIACERFNSEPEIGTKIIRSKSGSKIKKTEMNKIIYKEYCLVGFSVFHKDNKVYYFSLDDNFKNVVNKNDVLNLFRKVFSRKDLTARQFDCKEQIKLLNKLCGFEFECTFLDPKIVDWLLNSDSREKSLYEVVKKYSSELIEVVKSVGKSQNSLSINISSSISGKIRSTTESLITWYLIEAQHVQIENQNWDLDSLLQIEMNVIKCLARMEIVGFGVDREKLEEILNLVQEKMAEIEARCFYLVGRHFSLSSPSEVAKVLKLNKSRKGSTSKQVLEKLENNPLAPLIVLWRKLNSVLTKILFPLLHCTEINRIYGSSDCFNCTGRISMYEPNLQNVPRDFPIEVNNVQMNLSVRSAFVPKDGYILISADYCQLELRLLAYFSQDEILCDSMKSTEDVFRLIAANWNGISTAQVDDMLRQRTKQTCYGIIYGMGAKTLGEQLEIDEFKAAEFIESFKDTYPKIREFIQKTINDCRELKYVETLFGRRRYLNNINNKSPTLQRQAERQAVNTVIQGSAADIAKTAMIAIENSIKEKYKTQTNDTASLVLHLHDELLYEVKIEECNSLILIIKNCMESAVDLTIPFPVKVRCGPSWGELKEIVF